MKHTKTRISITEAAAMLGCSKSTARRKLKHLATFCDYPQRHLQVDVAAVLKVLARDRGGELPILPELQALHEQVNAMTEAMERLIRGVVKIGKATGVKM